MAHLIYDIYQEHKQKLRDKESSANKPLKPKFKP